MCGCKGQTPLDEWFPEFLAGQIDRLRAELATSFNTIRHTGARVAPIGDKRPMTGAGTVVGWALRETSGAAPATVLLRDAAQGEDGVLVFPIHLVPGESVRDWFGPVGVSIGAGVAVEVVGAVEGALFLGGAE